MARLGTAILMDRAPLIHYGLRYDSTREIASGGCLRAGAARLAMSRFGYWRDPLFQLAVAAYAVNRWLVKPITTSPFLLGQFDDLWLIPAALPVVLWLQRRLGWRCHDLPPSWSENFGHLAVWSLVCELVGPTCLHHGTGDPWDLVAYGCGALAAGLWWNRRVQPSECLSPAP